MGAWGTAIASNDTFGDVRDDFFDLYNDGHAVAAISEYLIAKKQEIVNDPEEANNFWFALAKAEWECKMLSPELFNRVEATIESGADLEVWRELDATPQDLKKRETVLANFLEVLRTERLKAKTRKKKIFRPAPFRKGDCLTFQLANGNYGGAVVLEAFNQRELGYNLLAVTTINQNVRPIRLDFENADVLVEKYENLTEVAAIFHFIPVRFKQEKHFLEIVDTVQIDAYFEEDFSRFYGSGGVANAIINPMNRHLEDKNTKFIPTLRIKIFELITAK